MFGFVTDPSSPIVSVGWRRLPGMQVSPTDRPDLPDPKVRDGNRSMPGDPRGPQLPPAHGRTGDGSSRFPGESNVNLTVRSPTFSHLTMWR